MRNVVLPTFTQTVWGIAESKVDTNNMHVTNQCKYCEQFLSGMKSGVMELHFLRKCGTL